LLLISYVFHNKCHTSLITYRNHKTWNGSSRLTIPLISAGLSHGCTACLGAKADTYIYLPRYQLEEN